MYHLTQNKQGISSVELRYGLCVTRTNARKIRHNLAQVMERDATKQLSGRVELDDAYLGRECTGGKRGRGAPGQDTNRRRAVETAPEGKPVAPETARGSPDTMHPRAFDLRQAEPRYDVQGGQRWPDLFRCLGARRLCASGQALPYKIMSIGTTKTC
jgi:hypothetical protein